MDKRYLSRKFWFGVAGFVAGVVFFSIRWLTAEQWMNYTQWIIGLYLAANVGDTAAEKIRS